MGESDQTVPVTVLNFVRAETDMTMDRYVKMGAFGKFLHIRQPTPLDKQDIIRMNRDTLYSFGTFDLTEPLTITKPDPGSRFMTLNTSNQDHSISQAIYGGGDFTFRQEDVGSRYMFVGFRTAVNANDPEDINKVNELQDQIQVRQADVGTFEIPNWDLESLSEVRAAVLVLANTMPNTNEMFGEKSELDPLQHLMGTAFGWGGNPKETAIYLNVVPAQNDGKVPHVLTVKDVPVDGFWSITIYNARGFMEPNERNAVSVSSVTGEPNADGSITVHFGGPDDAPNQLPIMPGWNYLVRLYQPCKELLDGSWTFPTPEPIK
jgi:hypothetical protein